MSSWLHATPQILLAVGILAVPGLVVGLSLRLRLWDAVGLSAPLSLGVLALANEGASHAGIRWGLPVIVGTTMVVAALCLACVLLFDRSRGRATSAGARADAAGWAGWQHGIAALVTLGAAVVGAIAVARGIGTPHSLNQTFDGVFHVNSINAIAQHHSAATSVIAGVTNPGLPGGFYPPTFGGAGGLLVIYGGVNAIEAANIMAVAMTAVWPLTLSIAVRRFARPRVFGYSIAMVGAVTVALFPALLLRFGTLWPNALSYLALAPALVVLLRLLALDGAGRGEPPADRLPLLATWIAAAISIPGLALAHPGAVYLVFYLAIPALIWVGWHRFVIQSTAGPHKRALAGVATVGVVGVLFVGVVWASSHISSIESVRHQYWPPVERWDQAIGQVLLLGSPLNPPNLALAVLALSGAFVALRSPIGRYLLASFVIVAAMAVATSAIQTHATMRWTGFWYNDPYRLFAALAAIVAPLVALGADELRSQLAVGIGRLEGAGVLRWPSRYLSASVAGGLVVCVGIVGLQGGLGTRKISNVVSSSYANAPHHLVNAGEAAMFERLKTKIPAGMTIAGDPFTGEALAGVLSGHPVIYATFGQPRVPDRQLVAAEFSAYQESRDVCAAVKRLKIAVVITGRHYFMENANRHRWFAGFDRLAHTPGLTKIDSGGGATAYRVGNCRS